MSERPKNPGKAAEEDFLDAAIAIWEHLETHATYRPGNGYRWQTGDAPCTDPDLHERLAIAEGEAWHRLREVAEAEWPEVQS